MNNIEVNGAHVTEDVAKVLGEWQIKTESISDCYIRVIEDTIDYLIDEEAEPIPPEKILGRIKTLRMMKKDIETLSMR